MDEENDFSALYKKLIGRFDPEPERNEAVLCAILRLLPGAEPSGDPELSGDPTGNPRDPVV